MNIKVREGFEGFGIDEKNSLRRPLRIKFGVDPTAKEITFGWYVLLRELRRFQESNHEIVLVIGDFTAQIGDPTGKSKTRKSLTKEEVDRNLEELLPQFWKVLDEKKTLVVRNSTWLDKLTIGNFIEIASRVTVSNILSRDDFSTRLENNQPLGMHEILYPLCQAWDSVTLNPDIEVGGSDQRFNIFLGRDLMKSYNLSPQAVFLAPLLIGTDGKQKMSQSLGNFISIRENPTDMFGKTMSIPDELILPWADLLLNAKGITSFNSKDPYEDKKHLAAMLVQTFYNGTKAGFAHLEWLNNIADKKLPENVEEVQIPTDQVIISLPAFIVSLGLSESNSKAKNLIDQGGVSLDSNKIIPGKYAFSQNELLGKILKVGKREFRKLISGD